MSAIVCPKPDQLEQFLIGQLDESSIGLIGDHLDSCESCRRKANSQFAHCELAHALRNPPDDRYSSEVELQRVQSAIGRGLITRSIAERSSQLPSTEDETLVMPAQMGPYKIIALLGKGSMGIVWLAEDCKLDRQIALKVMKPKYASNPTARRRFIQEARAAAKLSHDHIMPIFQVGEEFGVPYITMPVLQGQSLDQLLKVQGQLTTKQALKVGYEIAEGLQAAHEAGLIHRDIKPANIWFESQQGNRVKILDFGLARSVSEDHHLTQSGFVLGTPEYMAPEQARGTTIDHRCDLFSLGCLLYRMTTGSLPFIAKDTTGILMAIATKTPIAPSRLNSEMPSDLSNLIMKLLEKDPANRPQTAGEVARLLRSLFAKSKQQKQDIESPLVETIIESHPIAANLSNNLSTPNNHRSSTWQKFIVIACIALILISVGTYQLSSKSNNGTPVVKTENKPSLDTQLTQPKIATPGVDQITNPKVALELSNTFKDAEAPNPGIDPLTPWTIEAIVTLPETEYQQTNLMQFLMFDSVGDLGVSQDRWYFYSFHDSIFFSEKVVKGQPTHVAGVRTPKQRLLFINGKRVASNDWDITNAQRPMPIPSLRLSNGIENSTILIREIRISQMARYDQDFNPMSQYETDLHTLALYHLDEGKGLEFNDSSGHNHHGKLIKESWFIPSELKLPKVP